MEAAAQPQTPVQVIQKPEVPKWLVLVLMLLLGILGGFGLRGSLETPKTTEIAETSETGTQVQVNDSEQTSDEVSTQVQFFAPETTKRLSFPATKEGVLHLVSTEPGDLVIPYAAPVSWGGGWLGHGTTDPTASPDLTKIGLITKAGEFRVVNSEGKLIMSAGSALKADYVTAWAPDSSGVIFHVTTPTLYDSFVPMGPVPEDQIPQNPSFQPGQGVSGFYWVDLVNKKISLLAPLDQANVLEWVDHDRLLVSIQPQGSSKEIFATFNLQTYQADAAPYKPVFENLFGPQMSFGALGKKWALSVHHNANGGAGTETVKIVLADFPSLTGTTIAEGAFAMIQQPILSPDETKVIYQGHDVVNGPNFTYYFDGQKAEKLFEGIPVAWIDNQSFIVANFNPEFSSNLNHATKYFKYDVTTKKTTELYQTPVVES